MSVGSDEANTNIEKRCPQRQTTIFVHQTIKPKQTNKDATVRSAPCNQKPSHHKQTNMYKRIK